MQIDDATINDIRARRSYDGSLAILMDLAFGPKEEVGLAGGFSLTVSVNGHVLSGTAITRKAWLQGVAETLRTATGAPTAEELQKLGDNFEQAMESLAARVEEVHAEQEERGLIPVDRGWVHMKDVVGDGPFSGHKFVRIMLDRIDAWTLG